MRGSFLAKSSSNSPLAKDVNFGKNFLKNLDSHFGFSTNIDKEVRFSQGSMISDKRRVSDPSNLSKGEPAVISLIV